MNHGAAQGTLSLPLRNGAEDGYCLPAGQIEVSISTGVLAGSTDCLTPLLLTVSVRSFYRCPLHYSYPSGPVSLIFSHSRNRTDHRNH